MNNEKPEEGRKTFRKSYILMFLSLIAAFALWFYVIDSTNPVLSRTFADIPVEVMNQNHLADKGLAAVEDIEEYVNIKVSGKRSTILGMKDKDLVAAIDLSGCVEGDNYVDLDIHTPGSVELESVSKPQIRVTLEAIVSEERPVKVRFIGDLSGKMEAVCLSRELEEVEVTGAKSLVAETDEVTAYVDVALLDKEEREFSVALKPVDKDGGEIESLTLSREDMEIRAQIYNVKEVPLTVETVGELPAGLELESVKTPDKVLIALPEDLAENVNGILAKQLDLSAVTETTTVKLDLVLPDHVRLAKEATAPEAVITVRKQG